MRAFSEQYQLGTLQQTLKFVAGPLDAAHSSITLNPDKPVVGGTVTAIWTAKDANDNPVTGLNPDAVIIGRSCCWFYGIRLDG